jgi:hypothetical protein
MLETCYNSINYKFVLVAPYFKWIFVLKLQQVQHWKPELMELEAQAKQVSI